MDKDVLARMNDGEKIDRILQEFNAATLDPVGPLGGDQGMALLKDMKDLEAGPDDFVRSLAPRVDPGPEILSRPFLQSLATGTEYFNLGRVRREKYPYHSRSRDSSTSPVSSLN